MFDELIATSLAEHPYVRNSYTARKCSDCVLLPKCLPRSLENTNLLQVFESAVVGSYPADAGESLLNETKQLEYLFIVKSGSVKAVSRDGSHHILSFHFPPNIIGFDAFNRANYPNNFIAVERSLICVLNTRKFTDLLSRFPMVNMHFIESLGTQYSETLQLFAVIRSGTVAQKVAAFLLYISRQYNRQRLSSIDIVLPMARSDISNFLGVSPESLSRTLTSLSKKRLIKVFNRRVTLLNHEGLTNLVAL